MDKKAEELPQDIGAAIDLPQGAGADHPFLALITTTRAEFLALQLCDRDESGALTARPERISGTWIPLEDGSWRDTASGTIHAEGANGAWADRAAPVLAALPDGTFRDRETGGVLKESEDGLWRETPTPTQTD